MNHPTGTQGNIETRRGRMNNFHQNLRDDNQNHQHGQRQQQDEIENAKIKYFTPIRKQVCHQFAQETRAKPGSKIWVDGLLNFFTDRGQFGVTRESIKVWHRRQPDYFKKRAGARTGTGTGSRPGARARNGAGTRLMNSRMNSIGNLNYNIPPQQQHQQEQSFQNHPTSIQFPMQIPIQTQSSAQNQIPNPTPAPSSAPVSAKLTDDDQKKKDFDDAFEHIRKLHLIFHKQGNHKCGSLLDQILSNCRRDHTKFLIPKTFEENLNNGHGKFKQEMKHSHQNDDEHYVLGDIPDQDPPEMIDLS